MIKQSNIKLRMLGMTHQAQEVAIMSIYRCNQVQLHYFNYETMHLPLLMSYAQEMIIYGPYL